MRTTIWKATVCMVMILAVVACLPAFAQPPDGGGFGGQGGPPGPPGMGPGGGQPGMMGPGMGMGRGMMGPGMGMPPTPPQPVVVVADGVVYVAFDGKIMAFEAKTLHKLSEATYSERPGMRRGPGPRDLGGGPGGGGGDQPAPAPHEGPRE